MSTRMFSVIVEFADARIKPRSLKIEADTRKQARRAARAQMAEQKPAWRIKQVTAEPCAVKRTLAEIRSEPGYDIRKAAALVADAFGKKGTPTWWDAYRAEKAHLLAEVAEPANA